MFTRDRQPSEVPSGPTARGTNSFRKTAARHPRIGRNGSGATDVYAHANGLFSGPFPHVGKMRRNDECSQGTALGNSVRLHGSVANSFRKTAALQIRTHRTERRPEKRTDRPLESVSAPCRDRGRRGPRKGERRCAVSPRTYRRIASESAPRSRPPAPKGKTRKGRGSPHVWRISSALSLFSCAAGTISVSYTHLTLPTIA